MSSQITDGTLDLVRRVIELNCDGEQIESMSARDIARTLAGSGLSRDDAERALSELSRRGELVEADDGYRLDDG
ncbi:hypothetical protein DVK02_10135 [Halobellus sp. Atlit-31R]|nr:hypothetical protein DVK02_10135 [Halobellus sp. Atlit-31R]